MKRKTKKEETKQNFEVSYLGNAGTNLECGWRAFPQQKSSSFLEAARSYVHVIVLPVNLYTVWHASFLGTAMCLN